MENERLIGIATSDPVVPLCDKDGNVIGYCNNFLVEDGKLLSLATLLKEVNLDKE